MDARDVRRFIERDWGRIAESKAEYWAQRKRELGVVEALRIADELRKQVIATRPGWPTEADRASDLAAHTKLSRLLRDASAALRG